MAEVLWCELMERKNGGYAMLLLVLLAVVLGAVAVN
jgi:hypothetical protein